MCSRQGLNGQEARIWQTLDLYEATANGARIRQAVALQSTLDQHFWDGDFGGYFMTSRDHEQLLARDKPSYDGAEPSGNSVALMNLLRLAELTTKDDYRKRAEQGLAAFSRDLATSASASPKILAALECYLDRPLEVFVIKPDAGAPAEPLVSRFRSTYLPNRVFTLISEGQRLEELARLVPGLEGKTALRGATTAFVCERGRCELPTSEPEVFARQLSKIEPLARAR